MLMKMIIRRNIFIIAMLAAVAVPSGCGGGSGSGVSLKTPPTTQGGAQAAMAVKISSFGYHTCALDSVGGVKCWGLNQYGQLGDGTTTDRSAPVAVSGLTSGVASMAAGYFHTCVLTTSGGVKCWGYNDTGELGDGTTENRLTPVDVSGLTSGVLTITAGGYHTCAVTTNGAVKCWGYNFNGQLGDGTTSSRLTPIAVSGLTSGITELTGGECHTCALSTGGGVKCWGRNSENQLGDNTRTDRITPVIVSGLTSGVTTLSAGENHTCALTTNGGVKCWGENYYGNLGNGTKTIGESPVDVSGLTSGVTTIAVGGKSTCALTPSGGIKCWGYNQYGQLGDGTTTERHTPVNVSSLTSGIITIAAGKDHTCALRTIGGIKCWGSNGGGQLGDGTTAYKTMPVSVSGLTSDVIAVAAGRDHTCALAIGGGVKCWGENYYGLLGDGTTAFRATPVDVSSVTSGITAIAAGGSRTCVITSGGGARCWGSNEFGELGDGTTTNSSTPVNVSGLTSGVIAIVTSFRHTCALTTNGSAKCWGENIYGKLGDGTTTERHTPVNVSGLTSGVTTLGAGDYHTCALNTAGGVKCWGDNEYGQLGNGSITVSTTPVDVYGLTSGVAALAVGYNHACAVTNSGGVKCWGHNEFGQLGFGATNSSTPVNASNLLSGVMAIAAGGDHTCALTTGGGVKCWGGNRWGQLGDGTTTDRSTPADVSGLTSGVTAIAEGGYHTCALTNSGGIKCWGYNTSGNLGDGNAWKTTPVDVVGY